MFNAGTLKATLKLDGSQFKSGVEAAKTQANGLKATFTSLSSVTNMLLAGSFIYATKKLLDFAEQGARLKDMQLAFYRMGGAAKNVIEDVRGVTKALSDSEIMQAANTLEVLGVGMENTARLAKIARAAGVALNRDMKYLLESLTMGTARQSKIWLDQVGIILDVEQANKDYARQLGKTTAALSEQEKQAAFLNAVLSKGSGIISRVGEDAGSAVEPFQALAASVKNLKDELAIASADMGPFIGKLAELLALGNKYGLFLKPGKKFWSKEAWLGFSAWQFTRPTPPGPGGNLYTWWQQHLAGPGPAGTDNQEDYLRRQGLAWPWERGPEPWSLPEAMKPGARLGTIMPEIGQPIGEGIIQQSEDAIEAFQRLNQTFEYGQSLALAFGDAIATAFHTLITDSKNAAKAFASAFLTSIGRIASGMGDFFIQTAIAAMAVSTLAWPVALAAGIGLKALGGMLSGLGEKTAPAGMTSAYAPPSRVEDVEARGGTTIIIEGDFNGDPVWIDRLAEKLRLAGRDRNVKVVWGT